MDHRSVRFSAKPPLTYPPVDRDRNVSFYRLVDQLPLPSVPIDDAYVVDIHTASSVGAVDVVQELVQKSIGVSNAVQKENESKWTALMYAAYLGHDNVCECLLHVMPATINQKNVRGQTALMLSASCGNMNTVRALVKKSTDLNISDENGCTALHHAVFYSQLNAVELLLEYGADPNFANLKGMTPTLIASSVGHELILGALLQKGGDPLKKNNKGENGYALALDHPKILKAIEDWKTTQNDNAEVKSVAALLRVLKLEKYQGIFEQKNIDLCAFFHLTDSDLSNLGIGPFGPRKKLVNVIERFKANGVIVTEPDPHHQFDMAAQERSKTERFVYDSKRQNDNAEEEIRRLKFCLNTALNTQKHLNKRLHDFASTSKTTANQVLEQLRVQQPVIPHHIYISIENQLHELIRKSVDIERSGPQDDF